MADDTRPWAIIITSAPIIAHDEQDIMAHNINPI